MQLHRARPVYPEFLVVRIISCTGNEKIYTQKLIISCTSKDCNSVVTLQAIYEREYDVLSQPDCDLAVEL